MSLCLTPRIDGLASALTRRDRPLFDTAQAGAVVHGRRFLMVGAAGSIGAATLLEMLPFEPEEILVLDPSENNLAELLRTVRSAPKPFRGRLRVEPLDYGSRLAAALLAAEESFDYVLSFAALKHVRSERDRFSILRMLEVNLLAADRFLGELRVRGHGGRGVFFVSTDKAADPISLMGASKRAMEELLWAHAQVGAPRSLLDDDGADIVAPLSRVTTARFANVAFSDGSLPWAFLQRLEKRQPLAVPSDVKRYFVSPAEAGRLCLNAAILCKHRSAMIPALDLDRDAHPFAEVARLTLADRGLAPTFFDDEQAARSAVESELAKGCYPVLMTRADTSGEKEMEVFVGEGEVAEPTPLDDLLAVPALVGADRTALRFLLRLVRDACAGHGEDLPALGEIIEALRRVVPALQHRDTGRSLDDRM